ncbi:NTE family protein rssA [Serratia marcescens]|uniref:patatin-like phospholipase family protein n=1 Tax=Serratia marcescens TaxID=615 RepID=UPI000744EFA5|nr:patatin-like phospholipase family protein [Serratia marcescens]CUZ57634.1 NTE family protein rssA [Serratia marcescens]
MLPHSRPKVGLALGSGSARGWSHIGVIRALQAAGYKPDIICGTSIGALVGAVHAAGHLDWLEAWVRKLDWQGILTLMDFNISGGLLEGRRLVDFFRQRFNDEGIEKLSMPFACVATELQTGREVWLNEGSVIDAVRASIALPGLFTPAQYEGHVLVDGGLVNPVPVSLCRAMGADVVIAVDLNWDLIGRRASASPSRLNESMDLHAEPPAKTGFSAGGSQESAAYHRRWFGPIKQSIVRC